jgi:hypothetical protein
MMMGPHDHDRRTALHLHDHQNRQRQSQQRQPMHERHRLDAQHVTQFRYIHGPDVQQLSRSDHGDAHTGLSPGHHGGLGFRAKRIDHGGQAEQGQVVEMLFRKFPTQIEWQ